MSRRGKKYAASRQKVERNRQYPVAEALKLLKEAAWAKFDETVDLALNLGVNPKYSDQMVRGAAVLPGGTGKKIRVAVFAKGDKAKEAEEAGAEIVGAEDLAEKIEGGFLDFDTVIATPDMMKIVSKLGKILGRRGLMPNPKVGTVTMEVSKAVGDARKGKVEFRVEKEGILHVPLGKVSFSPEQLQQNLTAVMEAVMKAKPAAAKGTYVKKATISSTMGPGIRINVDDLVGLASV